MTKNLTKITKVKAFPCVVTNWKQPFCVGLKRCSSDAGSPVPGNKPVLVDTTTILNWNVMNDSDFYQVFALFPYDTQGVIKKMIINYYRVNNRKNTDSS